MTTLAQLFGTSTSLAVSTGSWSSGSCISTAALDLEPSGTWTTAPDDVELTFEFVIPNSSLSGQKAVNIWIAPSEDGTHYPDNDQYSGSANTPTLESPTNWYGPYVINARQNVTIYGVIASLRALCGGILPRKCGFILDNETGVSMSNSGGTTAISTATPINFTNQ